MSNTELRNEIFEHFKNSDIHEITSGFETVEQWTNRTLHMDVLIKLATEFMKKHNLKHFDEIDEDDLIDMLIKSLRPSKHSA